MYCSFYYRKHLGDFTAQNLYLRHQLSRLIFIISFQLIVYVSSSSSLNDNKFCLGFLSFFFFILASFLSVELSGAQSVFRLTGFLKIIFPSAGSDSSDYVSMKRKN